MGKDVYFRFRFEGGLDTEANDKTLVPGTFTRLENVRFRERITHVKRFGNELIDVRRIGLTYAEVSGCLGVASRDDESEYVMLGSDNTLYGLVEGAGWNPKGTWVLLRQDELSTPRGPNEAWDATTCSTGNLRYVAWQDARGGIFCRTLHVDPSDGTTRGLTPEFRIGGDRGYYPRLVMNGGRPQCYFISGTTLNVGVLNAADPSSTSVALSQLSNELPQAIITSASFPNPYDVVPVPGVAAVALGYAAQNGIKLTYVSPLGATPTAGVTPIWVQQTGSSGPALAFSAVGNTLAVVYMSGSTGGPVFRTYAASDLSPGLTTRAIDTDTMVTGSGVRRLTAVYDPISDDDISFADSYLNVAVEVSRSLPGTTPDDPTLRRVKTYQIDGGTVVSSGTFLHARLASKGFTLGGGLNGAPRGSSYVWVHTPYKNQSTDFLLRMPDRLPVARSGYSTSYPDVSGALSTVDVTIGPDRNDLAYRATTRRDRVPLTTSGSQFSGRHHVLLRTEYQPSASFRPTDVDGVLHLNGGWAGVYDGDTVVESNAALAPEGISASLGSSSLPLGGGILNSRDMLGFTGAPATASMVYEVIPYRSDARGNTVWGPGTLFQTNLLATSNGQVQNTASLSWHSLAATVADGTHAPNWAFAVFRTSFVQGTPGTTRQRIDDPTNPIVNNTGSDLITFVDSYSNSVQQVGAPSYTNVEDNNILPPAYRSSAAAGDRLYIVGLEGSPNTVQVSKLKNGGAVHFEDAGTFVVDSVGGPIKAVYPLDAAVAIFKRNRVYTAPVDPTPNNLSTDSTPWPLANLQTSVDGVQDHPVVVTVSGETIQGLMFKSERGIRLLDRGGTLQNKGWPVDRFKGLTVVGAVCPSTSNDVRFYSAEGVTQVLDTRFDRWATDPGQPSVSACSWQGRPVFVRQDGRSYAEVSGTYRDGGDGYSMIIESGWLEPWGMQARGRLVSLDFIGEIWSTHRLRVEIAFDYRDDYVTVKDFTTTASMGILPYGGEDGVADEGYGSGSYGGFDPEYRFRIMVPNQNCQAFRLRITDLDWEGTGQSYSMIELQGRGQAKDKTLLPRRKRI